MGYGPRVVEAAVRAAQITARTGVSPSNRAHPASDIIYPDSDGKPLGESDWHITEILYLLAVLRMYFRETADVYVAGDMFLYYEEGDPGAVVAPDVMVIRGVDKRMRGSYRLWDERQVPCCVVEITSRSSRFDDLGTKRAVYASLGVREYFVFDPLGEYLTPPLVRFRLSADGEYERTDGPQLESGELGVRFSAEDGRLRVYDLTTGRRLLDPEELGAAQREAEQAQREAEQAQREAEQAQREAEQARREAELAQHAAEQCRADEQRARQAAETEVSRLRAELERLRRERA